MNKIGPTFGDELGVLSRLPFSWCFETGEIFYGESVTPEQREQIEKVRAAHDPAAIAPNVVSPEKTLALFLTQKFPDAPADVQLLAGNVKAIFPM